MLNTQVSPYVINGLKMSRECIQITDLALAKAKESDEPLDAYHTIRAARLLSLGPIAFLVNGGIPRFDWAMERLGEELPRRSATGLERADSVDVMMAEARENALSEGVEHAEIYVVDLLIGALRSGSTVVAKFDCDAPALAERLHELQLE